MSSQWIIHEIVLFSFLFFFIRLFSKRSNMKYEKKLSSSQCIEYNRKLFKDGLSIYHLNSRRIYRRNVFFRIEFVLYNFSRRSSSIARRLATMRARERCEMSSEEFVFQLSPAPVTFRWTLIKVPVFLVD